MNVASFVFDIESIVGAFDIDANNIVDIVADIAVEHIVVDDLHTVADVDAVQLYFLAAVVVDDLVVVLHYCLYKDDNVHVQPDVVADEDDHDLGCMLNVTICTSKISEPKFDNRRLAIQLQGNATQKPNPCRALSRYKQLVKVKRQP